MIIENLRSTLDFKINKELAQRLFDLYTYVIDRIADASVEVSLAPIDAALKVLLPLKSAWDSIPLTEQQKAAQQRMSVQSDAVAVTGTGAIASGAV